MTTRILFVCLGNICRSPAAEGVFRAEMPSVFADSAGTSDWHVGQAPYGPMQAAARKRGIDLSGLRARQVTATDFGRFDMLVGMDKSNVTAMEGLRPGGNETPIRLFLDFAPASGVAELPDPYYTREFDATLDLIETAVQGLRAALR